jgi:hypothetical protein
MLQWSTPQQKDELIDVIVQFWYQKMTREQCNLYIDHIYKVAPVCILSEGAATGHLPDRIFKERSRGKSLQYFDNKLKTDPDVIQRIKVLKLQ